ncbi:MAG: hypothetical protein JXR97_07780, partial [Planctomycetes bacterium]|nr:hypothetical protein [Planctomycetota bacterium]
AVCCGPNIVNFNREATLEEMISHIYGRISILSGKYRPHMFIREISIYIDHMKSEMDKARIELSCKTTDCFERFRSNLIEGIEYYHGLAAKIVGENKQKFEEELNTLRNEIESLFPTIASRLSHKAE